MFQLALVNVKVGMEIVPSLLSLVLIAIVTSAVGADVNTTLNVAVALASVTLPLIAETVMFGGEVTRTC